MSKFSEVFATELQFEALIILAISTDWLTFRDSIGLSGTALVLTIGDIASSIC